MPEPQLLETLFTYPWDLHDDGLERARDVIPKVQREFRSPGGWARVSCARSLVQAVEGARTAGVDGFPWLHDGLLRLEQLRWLGTACRKVLQ